MDAFDIGMTGIVAIVLLYFAFGLLIIETSKIYRDIRLAHSIHNEERNRLPELPKTAYVPRPATGRTFRPHQPIAVREYTR